MLTIARKMQWNWVLEISFRIEDLYIEIDGIYIYLALEFRRNIILDVGCTMPIVVV